MNLTRADEAHVLVELRCYCAAGVHSLIVRASLADAYRGQIFTLCPAARSGTTREPRDAGSPDA